jgi:L-asparaginase / beta-aspartyl-peptidase
MAPNEFFQVETTPSCDISPRGVLVIHGGAGELCPDRYPPELQAQYRVSLRAALLAGHKILSAGGSALDAVEATICVLEDDPLFNSGRGAVLNAAGKVELDASVMCSFPDETRRTASVTLVNRTKNPIRLAKMAYLSSEDTVHVVHSAPYIETLAEKWGLEMVQESYFHTPTRDEQYANKNTGDYTGAAKGTVGAVALDSNGHMAVGTSTGGKGGKLPGRIGDTPIPGAGYWCSDLPASRQSHFLRRERTTGMGISGTGDGDYFLRYAVCHEIYARMNLLGEDLESAARHVLREVGNVGGQGGVVGLTAEGEVVMEMNCSGMFRGWIDLNEGVPRVGIFSEDIVE